MKDVTNLALFWQQDSDGWQQELLGDCSEWQEPTFREDKSLVSEGSASRSIFPPCSFWRNGTWVENSRADIVEPIPWLVSNGDCN